MNVAGFRSEDPSDSRGEHGVCRRKRDVRSGETRETGKRQEWEGKARKDSQVIGDG
jgi:hypothetical protein